MFGLLSHLTDTALFIESLTLVASVLTLLYLGVYAFALYWQVRQKTARPDWKISSLFYAGIAFFALANLLRGFELLGHGETGGLTSLSYFVAMAFFALGFYFRMETASKYAIVDVKPPVQAKRAKQR